MKAPSLRSAATVALAWLTVAGITMAGLAMTGLAMTGLAMTGLAAAGAARGGERLQVAVSLLPQVWLVERVGGERVDVTALVAPGESPATHTPSDAQVTRLLRSALYFRVGVPFEDGPWGRALRSSSTLRVVDTREGIEPRDISGRPIAQHPGDRSPDQAAKPHGQGDDPHIWLSPRLLEIQAATVAAAMIAADPGGRQEYAAGLARVSAELEDLDRELRTILAPCAGRAMVVFHPSWGYLADDYGLRQIAIETAGREPTDREITDLARLARREEIGVVFVQPQIAGRTAQAIAQAIGGRTEILDPLAPDLPENLRRAAKRIAAACG